MSRTVAQLRAALAERQDALHLAEQRIAAVREVGVSDRGEVRAEVDGRGALVGLWLAPGTTGLHPRLLGELVVLAAERAGELARQRRMTIRALAEGDEVAREWERLTGPAPARTAGWDTARSAPDATPGAAPGAGPAPGPVAERDEDDAFSWDPASLRSDR